MDTSKLKIVMDASKYMSDDNKSEIFEKYGLECEITDYAFYTFGADEPLYFKHEYYISNGGCLCTRCNTDGSLATCSFRVRADIRPIIDYSDIDLLDLPLIDLKRNKDGILEAKFGFLPNVRQSYEMQKVLNKKLKNNRLLKSGNSYTIDIGDYNDYRKPASYDKLSEYLFNNKRYVIVKGVWIEVLPVEWWVDEKNKLLIAKKMLVSNIVSDDLSYYISNYFIKELCQIQNDVISARNSNEINISNNLTTITAQINSIKREEQLQKFMSEDVEKLELNSLSITVFGSNLAEHAKAISDASFSIIDTMDNDGVYSIKSEIEKINQSKSSNFIFSKKYSAREITQNNKKVLTNIEQSLNKQQEIMLEQVKRLNYTKKLIALFVKRLNDYILKTKNALTELSTATDSNKFENIEIETMRKILENKLQDYEKAVSVHTAQYENINLLFKNYAISLNKMMTYRNTILPGLFTAVAVSSGILAQQESLDSIKEIDILLDNVIQSNKTYLTNNKQIENLDESVHNMLINEDLMEPSEMEQTLELSGNKILTKK